MDVTDPFKEEEREDVALKSAWSMGRAECWRPPTGVARARTGSGERGFPGLSPQTWPERLQESAAEWQPQGWIRHEDRVHVLAGSLVVAPSEAFSFEAELFV